MAVYVDEQTCKANHKFDEDDRRKLDEILGQVTETAQWAKNHDGAHKRKGATIVNIATWLLSLGAVIVAIFALK